MAVLIVQEIFASLPVFIPYKQTQLLPFLSSIGAAGETMSMGVPC